MRIHDAEAKIFSEISEISHMGFLSFMDLLIPDFDLVSIPSSKGFLFVRQYNGRYISLRMDRNKIMLMYLRFSI